MGPPRRSRAFLIRCVHILKRQVVSAFFGGEGIEEFADFLPKRLASARGHFAEQCFDFGEQFSMGFRSGEYGGR